MLGLSKVYRVLMMTMITAASSLSWAYIGSDKINPTMNSAAFFYVTAQDGQPGSNDAVRESPTSLATDTDSPTQLAEAYRLQALDAFTQANFSHALVYLNKALVIDEHNALLYETRASVYEYLGKNQKALADVKEALRLDASDYHPYMTRGNIYYYQGEYKKALSDYGTFLSIYRGNLYRMLWYYQAASLLQYEGGDEKFSDYVAGADISVWPGPIVHLYLKRLVPEELLTMLASSEVNNDPGILCEAYFYIAQYYLMNNKPDAAAVYFKKARETNALGYIEYLYAETELLKLQK